MLEFLDRPDADAFTLRLDRAEQLCQARLKILRDVSQVTSVRFHAALNLRKLQDLFDTAYMAQLEKNGFSFMVRAKGAPPWSNLVVSGVYRVRKHEISAEQRRAMPHEPLDAVSFWLLKMAFSGSHELAEWHQWTESLLLYYNLDGFSSGELQGDLLAEVSQFLARRGQSTEDVGTTGISDGKNTSAGCPVLSDLLTAADLEREGDPLFQLTFRSYARELSSINYKDCDNLENYLVTAREAFPSLHSIASSRRFLMIGGRLLLHKAALNALFLPAFQLKYAATQQTCTRFPALGSPQLQELFALCRQWQAGPVAMDTLSYVMSGHRITLQNIDQAITRGFFPPCMLAVAESFKSTCHMKHPQRMQLTPFLVDCGMAVDEDLEWQRRIYSRGIGEQKFAKEYAYNIKHVHGTVGGRKVAHCSQCAKIIDTLPCSEKELCGCPFKYMKGDALGSFLSTRYRRQLSYMESSARVAVDRRVQRVVMAAGGGEPDRAGAGAPQDSAGSPAPPQADGPISPIDMQYITLPAQMGDCKTACAHLLEITYGIEGVNVQPVKYYNSVVRRVRGEPLDSPGDANGTGDTSVREMANMSVDEMKV